MGRRARRRGGQVCAVFVKHQLIAPQNVGLVYPLDETGKPAQVTR